jgi:hypothetical protein
MSDREEERAREIIRRALESSITDDVRKTFVYRQEKGIYPEKTTLSPSDRILHDISVTAGANEHQLHEMGERFLRTFRGPWSGDVK